MMKEKEKEGMCNFIDLYEWDGKRDFFYFGNAILCTPILHRCVC